MPSRQGSRSPVLERSPTQASPASATSSGAAKSSIGGPSPAGCSTGASLTGAIGELRVVLQEDQPDGADRAVAVLGEDQLGAARILGVLVVVIVAVEEADHVRVLLDRARLAQVREDRALVGALLRGAGELGDADDRDGELTGEDLESAAEL